MHHAYPEFEVIMLVYRCRLAPGSEPRCVEVRDLAWVPVNRATEYDVLPADRPLLERLRAEWDAA
jgi:hypothetical protein